MSTSARYTEAALPNTSRALGVNLLPVTMGHAVLLQRIGSPFAPFVPFDESVEIGFGDVAEAIHVLSRPWDVAERQLRGRIYRVRMFWWALRFLIAVKLRPWKALSVPTASAAIARHVRECCTGPGVFPTRTDGRSAEAPYLAILEVTLRRRLHVQNPMDCEIRRALWLTSVDAELEGAVEFRSDRIPDQLPPMNPETGKPAMASAS